MKKPELSNLSVNKYKDVGYLAVIAGRSVFAIDGTCCEDHDTNLSCIGVAAMEQVTPDHKKVRVSNRITSNILKEIKFTY